MHKATASKGRAIFSISENAMLMEFLMTQMPSQSRTKVKLLSNKQVFVDGKSISHFNHRIVSGQKVEVSSNRKNNTENVAELTLIYEDEDIIVKGKQADLLSILTAKEKRAAAYSLLSEHVKRQDKSNKIFVVHWLNRDTLGVMLFAKSERVKRRLQYRWKDTVFERSYIALVEGAIEKQDGAIASYLFEDKSFLVHSSPNSGKVQKVVIHYLR